MLLRAGIKKSDQTGFNGLIKNRQNRSETGTKFKMSKNLNLIDKPNEVPVNRSVLLIYRTNFDQNRRFWGFQRQKNLRKSIKIIHIVVSGLVPL
jgi:hypothetical protein